MRALTLGLLALLAACSGDGTVVSGPDSGGAGGDLEDADGDGVEGSSDCDDNDPDIYPGATDIWYDGIDSDCDGASDYDADGDAYDAEAHGGSDCNDADADVNPGATDVWYDGVDSNCDGASDDDADGDGVDLADDCDDTDPDLSDDCPDPDSPIEAYEAITEADGLDAISSNLSGVSWNAATGTYMAVLDSNRMLVEISAELEILREIDIDNVTHSDLEDIAYLGEEEGMSMYAMGSEDGVMYIGPVADDGSTEVDFDGFQEVTYAAEPENRNRGGEGVAFDPVTETIWTCVEKDPMTVYRFVRPAWGSDASYTEDLDVVEPFDAQTQFAAAIDDISSCIYDPRTERLLVLSHESQRILDVDLDGTIVGYLDIASESTSLTKPEGLALNDDGDLLIVGEPNVVQLWRSSAR